jgi:hypothetical protein
MLHSFKMVERRMITRRKISVGDSEYILATSTIFGTCPVILRVRDEDPWESATF